MKKTLLAGLAVGLSLMVYSSNSQAALVNSEVANNAYITKGFYDVAWANPCAAQDPTCGAIDLSYQSQFGWKIMTTDIFNSLNISYLDFVVQGANVDYFTGNNYDEATGAYLSYVNDPVLGDVAIAVPYFSSYYHADWSNGVSGLWDPISDEPYAEALVYRDSAPVPEPATMLLLGTGLTGLIGARRKKKA